MSKTRYAADYAMKWITIALSALSFLSLSGLAKTNVILITVEALRADHLGPYGYEKLKTPAISNLAQNGIVFEKVVVQTPLTLPSHATILTGTYPQYHGLQDVVGMLREDTPSLAEWFAERGYETGAFLGSAILLSQWGLNRGFETYDDHFSISVSRPTDYYMVERSAGAVLDRALTWLNEHKHEPHFLWIHFSDPHAPYDPPEPFATRYRENPYDGEIAYVDSILARFFGVLQADGLYDSSLIVLTSDHGVGLGEHGEQSHGLFLYESCLRVPLILKLPEGQIQKFRGVKNLRFAQQVRSVDIAPTIIRLLGESVPDTMQGEALVPEAAGNSNTTDLPAYAESYYSKSQFGWSPLFSYSSGNMKFIRSPNPELYDLMEDPEERNNLYHEQRALADEMERQLTEVQLQYAAPGYQLTEESGLPDPKSKVEIYQKLMEARSASREDKPKESIEILSAVARKEPENPAVHFMLGSEYLILDQFLLAIQEFRESLQLAPGSYEARINLALAYLHAGLPKKAEEILQNISQQNPFDFAAHQFRAVSLAKQGRMQEAILEGTKAVEVRPISAVAHYNLGAFYLRDKQNREAAESFLRVLEIEPDYVEAQAGLTVAYLGTGDSDRALEQARRTVESAPDYGYGHHCLGQVYLATGRRDEARKAFRKAKELEPLLDVPVL
jgi:arylsulfatase A-like enzyme/Tfp pilus assembly protein PilF